MRLLFILICIWNADSTSAFQEDLVAGDWSGTSICQVKNSACRDEQAWYHIAGTNNPLVYQVTGYKIVQHDSLNMGTLDFNYDKPGHSLSCTTRNGIFTLVITGNTINGELRTHDNILFRKILLKRN